MVRLSLKESESERYHGMIQFGAHNWRPSLEFSQSAMARAARCELEQGEVEAAWQQEAGRDRPMTEDSQALKPFTATNLTATDQDLSLNATAACSD